MERLDISGEREESRTQLVGNDVSRAADGVTFVSDYFKDQQESQKASLSFFYEVVKSKINQSLIVIF